MGDRCYARITVRKQDQEAWEALGYDDCDGESGENFIELVDYERNYGVTEWGDDLAAGCPMFGYHDEGGEYAAQVFAYDGETFLSHECNHNRMPVVECGPDGPRQEDIDLATEFLEFSSKVEVMVLSANLAS